MKAKFKMKSNKVYCDDCKWQMWDNLRYDRCSYPDNRVGYRGDEGLREPDDINKNNDCKWIEKK